MSDGAYRPDSLRTEGFIHFSVRSQIVAVANRLYRGRKNLLLLQHHAPLACEVRWEDCYQAGERFPHLYGALPVSCVSQTIAFPPNEDGTFTLPRSLWDGAEVHHVALRTPDVASLSAFYRDVLQMTLVREQPHSSWFAMGSTGVLMIENCRQHEPVPDPEDQHLICWGTNDLEETERRLHERGVTIELRKPKTLYFRDPEGRRLAFSSHPLSAT